MASIRKKGKRWYLRRYVGGRQIEEALETVSERKAREILAKYEARRSLGIDPPVRSKTPLAEFLQKYCAHLRLTLPPKSATNDSNRLACFFREIMLDRLEALTPALIQHTLEAKRLRDRTSAKTYNNYREILRRMFEHARKVRGFVSPDPRYPNPVDAVRKCREHASKITYLTTEEIDDLLAYLARNAKMRTTVAALIFTGLRRSELLWLTVDDLDMASRLIMVRGKTIGDESWEPKTRKNRAVPVSASLLQYLRHWIQTRPDSIWLFPAPKGGRWDGDNFSAALRDSQKRSAKRWSCLDFRHTFASHLAKKGVSIFKIAKLLGNTAAICERHYAHLSPAGLADEVEFRSVKTGPAAAPRSEQARDVNRARGGADSPQPEVALRPAAV